MRVLVTGIAGFIGSHLAEALLAEGHAVTGIDNLLTGRRENVPDGARFIHGDVTKLQEWLLLRLPEQWDVIYHCAASYKDRADWERDASTNVLGTINVVREAQRSGARVVYFQTSLCYGPTPKSPVRTDAPLDPRGSYAVSKTAGEAFIRDSGVDWVSLRLANIYGPRNLSGPVPAFYQRLTAGQPCTVVDSRRDFVFVDDLVRVARQAATQGHGVYHVSSGNDYAISDVYREVVAALGVEAPEPVFVARGHDDVATLLLDPLGTEHEYGWTVTTPLGTGIVEAVRWYEANGVTETYSHLAVNR